MPETKIDPKISNWVFDFLVRQPISDRILVPLAQILPIPNPNFLLSKLLLLRKLESKVSNCTISEAILQILHQIDALDECLGVKEDCCGSLKKAYCAVAVECSVRCLRESGNDVKGEYFDVVKRLWRGEVGVMEREGSRLVSEELLEWKRDFEASVWEEEGVVRLVERSGGVDAVEAVMGYLREERERMGPSFLEVVVERLKSGDGGVSGVICEGKRDGSDECRRNDGRELECGNDGVMCDKGKNVMADGEKRNLWSRRKHAAHKRSKGAKITNVDDSGAGPSCNIHLLDTPEVKRIREALEASRLELRAVMKDPLPEALRLAESVSGIANKDPEPPGGQNRGVDNALDVQSGKENAGCSGQTNAPKSLMERKETARTFEWDDSIDGSPEELSDSTSRPHLPSPRLRRVSPLNIYKEQKLKRQRKNKRWSVAEEDALRAGVEKYGKGYWKLILNQYNDIFEERTEVDLKDKWRNMTRLN